MFTAPWARDGFHGESDGSREHNVLTDKIALSGSGMAFT